MTNENGEWIIKGLDHRDPDRLKSADELIRYVNKAGFLPLFKNDIDGFSVEEHAASRYWWTGMPEDPWEWREDCAKSAQVAYGKFFGKKAGFISLEWLPVFVNYRRDGYDFESLYDDGKAQNRQKKIMDLFSLRDRWFSYEIKREAGFGKGGEKNYEGTVTSLMSMCYLVVCDFQRRISKRGAEYGMKVSQYSTPEALWGYENVTKCYCEEPMQSAERIVSHIKKLYPNACDEAIRNICL